MVGLTTEKWINWLGQNGEEEAAAVTSDEEEQEFTGCATTDLPRSGAGSTVIASREDVLGGVGRRRWDAARVGAAGKRRWKSRTLKVGVGGGCRLTRAAVVEVRDDQ